MKVYLLMRNEFDGFRNAEDSVEKVYRDHNIALDEAGRLNTIHEKSNSCYGRVSFYVQEEDVL